jgi:hypothetical protein
MILVHIHSLVKDMAQQGALPRIFEEGRQNDATFIRADHQINTRWRFVSGATRYGGLAPGALARFVRRSKGCECAHTSRAYSGCRRKGMTPVFDPNTHDICQVTTTPSDISVGGISDPRHPSNYGDRPGRELVVTGAARAAEAGGRAGVAARWLQRVGVRKWAAKRVQKGILSGPRFARQAT